MSSRVASLMLAVAALLGASAPSSLRADVFALANGGQITGRLEARPSDGKAEKGRVQEVVTSDGIRLQVAAANVVARERLGAAYDEWRRISPSYADTVDDHAKLAQWCQENGLPKQRKRHFERILELDPAHVAAHRALGHAFIGGKWTTSRALQESKGLTYVNGRWRTSQELELQHKRAAAVAAEKAWLVKIKQLVREFVSTGSDETRQAVARIDAPEALPALVKTYVLESRLDPRGLLLESLILHRNPQGTKALVKLALGEANRELLERMIEGLAERPPSWYDRSLVEALRDDDNFRVNRAGFLAGRLQRFPLTDALIAALVTDHMVWVPADFVPPPKTKSSVDGRMLYVSRTFANHEVLSALSGMTSQSFLYEKDLWRNWLASHRAELAKLDAEARVTRDERFADLALVETAPRDEPEGAFSLDGDVLGPVADAEAMRPIFGEPRARADAGALEPAVPQPVSPRPKR